MSDVRVPRNPSELRRNLKIGRAGMARDVYVSARAVYSNRKDSDHHFDIDVHPGSDITIHVTSGLPFLKVWRGTSVNVKVIFESNWGNSLEILPDQGASVKVSYADTKVTLTGDGRDLKVSSPMINNRVINFTHIDEAIIDKQRQAL